VTGARFAVLSGEASLLSRALIAFMLDLHTREHGYREVLPPFIVNAASLFGTGQLPKFEATSSAEGHRLVPRPDGGGAGHEPPPRRGPPRGAAPDLLLRLHPLLPGRGGGGGKDTRGLIRQHQFDKVELVKFTKAEESAEAHES
jgi:Seryl-tRNA synthetase